MSLTWVVKTINGGQTRFDRPDDGKTPMPYRAERLVEIGVDYGPATPCDVDCLEAFIVELQAAVAYLKGCDL